MVAPRWLDAEHQEFVTSEFFQALIRRYGLSSP